MMKRILGLFVLLLIASLSFAQSDNIARAEKLFGFVTAGMGDSINECLNDKVKQAIPKEMLSGLMVQLQPYYGKYTNHDAWRTEESMGVTLYCCDAHFDKGTLTFITAFDSDGKANTLRFVPAEKKVSQKEELPSDITEHALTIVSGSYKLPGLLTMPKNVQNVPAVVLIQGSGPCDKDETVGANRPFHDLAWALAQKGVVVLRYDKRTKVYGSKWIAKGEDENLDHEVVDDALAAIQLLMKQPSVDSKRIYVIGHSLGGMLAPRIAQRTKGLCGIIMMAAPSRPVEDVFMEQVIYLKSQGVPTAQDMAYIDSLKTLVNNAKKIGTTEFNEKLPLPLNMSESYCMDLKNCNQIETAKGLSLPILILQGVRDYQVTMQDFALWKRRLGKSSRIQYKSYPLLNHLFMEGNGPSTPAEYYAEHHIPGYVTDDIVKFINHERVY